MYSKIKIGPERWRGRTCCAIVGQNMGKTVGEKTVKRFS